ncbi:hypothetical protein RF55_13471 [Lasius niger]|uniref:Uncharacterized protein n=1 Tax=Lasius niger TaxID=67767 RepID=A0A0J7KAG0_LASNI|nr:hypothetical protein RF55_13471 [Lasius niger]
MEAFRNLPQIQEIPKNLPLPANLKILENLPFGARFYMYEDDSAAHAPPEPTLDLYSPYYGGNTWRAKNELLFSLKQGVSKHICEKKMPYILAVDGMVSIAVKEFAKHTKCTPTIGLLWFDNGESVSIGSDKSSCYSGGVPDGKGGTLNNQGNHFFGTLDAYVDYKETDTPEMREAKFNNHDDEFQTREIQHKLATLFQHHLPIAVSYGDYAVSFSYPDPTPIREFQKKLNDPKIFQEVFEYDQASTLSGDC